MTLATATRSPLSEEQQSGVNNLPPKVAASQMNTLEEMFEKSGKTDTDTAYFVAMWNALRTQSEIDP
jgi:hypothetical protein